MTHEKNKLLYKNTYASLRDRIKENGYAPTSVTGAYPGMFARDASEEALALMINGDFELTRKMLGYIFAYHKKYDFDFVIHVMRDNYDQMISDRHQADATFFLIHSWCLYVKDAPASGEKDAFIIETAPQIKRYIDHWMNEEFFNKELGLLRNPCFEHARDGSYFNCYDILTNVLMSQSLHEVSEVYGEIDGVYAKYCGKIADEIAAGVHKNLTAEIDGKRIYTELQSISKESGRDFKITEDKTFYEGLSGFNFFPMGIQWYALDEEIANNTYDALMKYDTEPYEGGVLMIDAYSKRRDDNTYELLGKHAMGKSVAWELLFCKKIGRTDRIDELVSFIERNSDQMYRETWALRGGGGDTANQEHASWMVYAMKQLFPSLGE